MVTILRIVLNEVPNLQWTNINSLIKKCNTQVHMSFIIKYLSRWSWNILDGIYLKEAWEHGRESEVGVLYISPSGQEQL